jgi:hypothetical protein
MKRAATLRQSLCDILFGMSWAICWPRKCLIINRVKKNTYSWNPHSVARYGTVLIKCVFVRSSGICFQVILTCLCSFPEFLFLFLTLFLVEKSIALYWLDNGTAKLKIEYCIFNLYIYYQTEINRNEDANFTASPKMAHIGDVSVQSSQQESLNTICLLNSEAILL